MLVVATFERIQNPSFSQKIRYFFKGENISITQKKNYMLAQVEYVGERKLQRIVPKLFAFSNTIVADNSVSLEDIQKYSLYMPKEFLNQVAVNTLCYAILRSRMPINKRNLTFVDREAKYIHLARILIEHFFCINVVTENIEPYMEFKNTMMTELGAVVMINSSEASVSDIYLSTDVEERGSFRIKEETFFCKDTVIRGIDLPHEVNALLYACALEETEQLNQYTNIVAELLVDHKTKNCIPIQNVVRFFDKLIE